MAKNIVIFSDGTGQGGGLLPDETRSNVYKLFRAARVCPDTVIDPARQVAFYDVGLGSKAAGSNIKIGWWRWIYNLLGSATGLGITQNIIDCYAEIIRVWEPGDRIYLVGFSRGAYTVRCLGAALSLCGVPTRPGDGTPFKRDIASAHALATEAIKQVYQFGAGKKNRAGKPDALFKSVRLELAAQFRSRYASAAPDDPTLSNAYPYFIGVWDTVATLGLTTIRFVGAAVVALAAIGVLTHMLALFLGKDSRSLLGYAIAAAVIAYFVAYVKFTTKSVLPWYKTVHLTGWRMVFYSTELNPNIQHARHALAIDENRKDFENVPWTNGAATVTTQKKNGYTQLKQVWFAGVHSDIGGGYPENEARLSDVTLEWMIEEAAGLPEPLIIDRSALHTWPSATEIQHDERKNAVAGWPGWFVRLLISTGIWTREELGWEPLVRNIPHDAPLHPTVLARLSLPHVLRYDVTEPYRPKALQNHNHARQLYPPANDV